MAEKEEKTLGIWIDKDDKIEFKSLLAKKDIKMSGFFRQVIKKFNKNPEATLEFIK